MFVVLVAHNTQGLKTDLAVVAQTLKNHFAQKIEVDVIVVPIQLTRTSAHVNEQKISITRPVDVVIFFEHTVDHPQFRAARHRILIPNPEWLMPHVVSSLSSFTEMWHKTHVSMATLAGLFPNLRHSYIGFTSPEFSGKDPDFDRFIHFKGVSVQKQTEIVLAAWRMHPEWPELSVQSYATDPAFLNFPEWLQCRNMRIKYCLMSAEEYRSEATRAGVHLCPSSVEGFGHYLNEARSMGALVVTTDAPPMNELVDDTCGVLITPVRTEQQNYATRHIIDVAGFEKAMQTVLEMPIDQRKALGANARRRYVMDHEKFQTELINQVNRLAQS
jgi:glycosyltransferase involved in cell wall biosynthesis